MGFLGTFEAVRYRLSGGPRLSVPTLRPILGAWDRTVPSDAAGIEASAKVQAYLTRKSFANVASLEVPVFFFDANGQSFKLTYPCLTFDIIHTAPRFANYVQQSESYRGDMFQVEVPQTDDTVKDDGEDLGRYPRQVSKRFVPHPFDITIEIRSYSLNPIEQGFLEAYVYDRFRPRDFLRVPMVDGSFRSWDVLFQSSQDLDRRSPVRNGSPGVEREYAKSYTYLVEGYLDNTDTAYLVNLVNTRTLNLAQKG